jgi:hypothetical protein
VAEEVGFDEEDGIFGTVKEEESAAWFQKETLVYVLNG